MTLKTIKAAELRLPTNQPNKRDWAGSVPNWMLAIDMKLAFRIELRLEFSDGTLETKEAAVLIRSVERVHPTKQEGLRIIFRFTGKIITEMDRQIWHEVEFYSVDDVLISQPLTEEIFGNKD